jgi:hypothetical protein
MIHKILLFNVSHEKMVDTIKQQALELLPAAGGRNVTFRPALNEGTVTYQYLITVDFASMEDHEAYMVHEKHVHFSKDIFRPNIDSSKLLIQFFKNEA